MGILLIDASRGSRPRWPIFWRWGGDARDWMREVASDRTDATAASQSRYGRLGSAGLT